MTPVVASLAKENVLLEYGSKQCEVWQHEFPEWPNVMLLVSCSGREPTQSHRNDFFWTASSCCKYPNQCWSVLLLSDSLHVVFQSTLVFLSYLSWMKWIIAGALTLFTENNRDLLGLLSREKCHLSKCLQNNPVAVVILTRAKKKKWRRDVIIWRCLCGEEVRRDKVKKALDSLTVVLLKSMAKIFVT